MSRVKVAARVRPLSQREIEGGARPIVDVRDRQLTVWNPKFGVHSQRGCGDSRERASSYVFDYVYPLVHGASGSGALTAAQTEDEGTISGPSASQERVFEDLGHDVIESAFEGYNACVLAYGQTGSGKTYTMMGAHGEEMGLIPRICQALFSRMEAITQEESVTCRVDVSYMEIYNEKVRDLLQPSTQSGKGSLKVREHPKDGPYVQDLLRQVVASYDCMKGLLEKGADRRATAMTHYHEHSSRSHAIFTINFKQAKLDVNLPSETVSKIHLVDLAGSERADTSGCTSENHRSRLKEGANINKSLVTLATVIKALADASREPIDNSIASTQTKHAARSLMASPCFDEASDSSTHSQSSGLGSRLRKSVKTSFVPYRNSVLTWLLKDSLGGNSKTIMIATISPSDRCYRETMSTLRYAQRAKSIVNTPFVNEDYHVKLIRELRSEISRLKQLLTKSQMVSESSPVTSANTTSIVMKLEQDEEMAEYLFTDWMESWAEVRDIMKESDVSIKRSASSMSHSSGVVIDSEQPHLIGMDPDILSTGIIIYNIKSGVTSVGRVSDGIVPDINLEGPGIEIEHCTLEYLPAETPGSSGIVYLHPFPDVACSINGLIVTEPQRLSQGDVVQLGQSRMFRFNHPSEAAELRRRRLLLADLSLPLRRHHSDFELSFHYNPTALSHSDSFSSVLTSGIDCESPVGGCSSVMQDGASSDCCTLWCPSSPSHTTAEEDSLTEISYREELSQDLSQQNSTESQKWSAALRREEGRLASLVRHERHLAALIAANEALQERARREMTSARAGLEADKLKHSEQVRKDLQVIIALRQGYMAPCQQNGPLRDCSRASQTEATALAGDKCCGTQTKSIELRQDQYNDASSDSADQCSAEQVGQQACQLWQGRLKAVAQKELVMRVEEMKQENALRSIEAAYAKDLQRSCQDIFEVQREMAILGDAYGYVETEEHEDKLHQLDSPVPRHLSGQDRNDEEAPAPGRGLRSVTTGGAALVSHAAATSSVAVSLGRYRLAPGAASVTSRLYPARNGSVRGLEGRKAGGPGGLYIAAADRRRPEPTRWHSKAAMQDTLLLSGARKSLPPQHGRAAEQQRSHPAKRAQLLDNGGRTAASTSLDGGGPANPSSGSPSLRNIPANDAALCSARAAARRTAGPLSRVPGSARRSATRSPTHVARSAPAKSAVDRTGTRTRRSTSEPPRPVAARVRAEARPSKPRRAASLSPAAQRSSARAECHAPSSQPLDRAEGGPERGSPVAADSNRRPRPIEPEGRSGNEAGRRKANRQPTSAERPTLPGSRQPRENRGRVSALAERRIVRRPESPAKGSSSISRGKVKENSMTSDLSECKSNAAIRRSTRNSEPADPAPRRTCPPVDHISFEVKPCNSASVYRSSNDPRAVSTSNVPEPTYKTSESDPSFSDDSLTEGENTDYNDVRQPRKRAKCRETERPLILEANGGPGGARSGSEKIALHKQDAASFMADIKSDRSGNGRSSRDIGSESSTAKEESAGECGTWSDDSLADPGMAGPAGKLFAAANRPSPVGGDSGAGSSRADPNRSRSASSSCNSSESAGASQTPLPSPKSRQQENLLVEVDVANYARLVDEEKSSSWSISCTPGLLVAANFANGRTPQSDIDSANESYVGGLSAASQEATITDSPTADCRQDAAVEWSAEASEQEFLRSDRETCIETKLFAYKSARALEIDVGDTQVTANTSYEPSNRPENTTGFSGQKLALCDAETLLSGDGRKARDDSESVKCSALEEHVMTWACQRNEIESGTGVDVPTKEDGGSPERTDTEKTLMNKEDNGVAGINLVNTGVIPNEDPKATKMAKEIRAVVSCSGLEIMDAGNSELALKSTGVTTAKDIKSELLSAAELREAIDRVTPGTSALNAAEPRTADESLPGKNIVNVTKTRLRSRNCMHASLTDLRAEPGMPARDFDAWRLDLNLNASLIPTCEKLAKLSEAAQDRVVTKGKGQSTKELQWAQLDESNQQSEKDEANKGLFITSVPTRDLGTSCLGPERDAVDISIGTGADFQPNCNLLLSGPCRKSFVATSYSAVCEQSKVVKSSEHGDSRTLQEHSSETKTMQRAVPLTTTSSTTSLRSRATQLSDCGLPLDKTSANNMVDSNAEEWQGNFTTFRGRIQLLLLEQLSRARDSPRNEDLLRADDCGLQNEWPLQMPGEDIYNPLKRNINRRRCVSLEPFGDKTEEDSPWKHELETDRRGSLDLTRCRVVDDRLAPGSYAVRDSCPDSDSPRMLPSPSQSETSGDSLIFVFLERPTEDSPTVENVVSSSGCGIRAYAGRCRPLRVRWANRSRLFRRLSARHRCARNDQLSQYKCGIRRLVAGNVAANAGTRLGNYVTKQLSIQSDGACKPDVIISKAANFSPKFVDREVQSLSQEGHANVKSSSFENEPNADKTPAVSTTDTAELQQAEGWAEAASGRMHPSYSIKVMDVPEGAASATQPHIVLGSLADSEAINDAPVIIDAASIGKDGQIHGTAGSLHNRTGRLLNKVPPLLPDVFSSRSGGHQGPGPAAAWSQGDQHQSADQSAGVQVGSYNYVSASAEQLQLSAVLIDRASQASGSLPSTGIAPTGTAVIARDEPAMLGGIPAPLRSRGGLGHQTVTNTADGAEVDSTSQLTFDMQTDTSDFCFGGQALRSKWVKLTDRANRSRDSMKRIEGRGALGRLTFDMQTSTTTLTTSGGGGDALRPHFDTTGPSASVHSKPQEQRLTALERQKHASLEISRSSEATQTSLQPRHDDESRNADLGLTLPCSSNACSGVGRANADGCIQQRNASTGPSPHKRRALSCRTAGTGPKLAGRRGQPSKAAILLRILLSAVRKPRNAKAVRRNSQLAGGGVHGKMLDQSRAACGTSTSSLESSGCESTGPSEGSRSERMSALPFVSANRESTTSPLRSAGASSEPRVPGVQLEATGKVGPRGASFTDSGEVPKIYDSDNALRSPLTGGQRPPQSKVSVAEDGSSRSPAEDSASLDRPPGLGRIARWTARNGHEVSTPPLPSAQAARSGNAAAHEGGHSKLGEAISSRPDEDLGHLSPSRSSEKTFRGAPGEMHSQPVVGRKAMKNGEDGCAATASIVAGNVRQTAETVLLLPVEGNGGGESAHYGPVGSTSRDESVETEASNPELERLRKERQHIIRLLAQGYLPSRLWQELAEAQLNYAFGQTDALLEALEDAASNGSEDGDAVNSDVAVQLTHGTDHSRALAIAREHRERYSAELEASKRRIEERIRVLEAEAERTKAERARARGTLQVLKTRRRAEIEIFKLERSRELQHVSLARKRSLTGPEANASTAEGEVVDGGNGQQSCRLRTSSEQTGLAALSLPSPTSHLRRLMKIRKNLVGGARDAAGSGGESGDEQLAPIPLLVVTGPSAEPEGTKAPSSCSVPFERVEELAAASLLYEAETASQRSKSELLIAREALSQSQELCAESEKQDGVSAAGCVVPVEPGPSECRSPSLRALGELVDGRLRSDTPASFCGPDFRRPDASCPPEVNLAAQLGTTSTLTVSFERAPVSRRTTQLDSSASSTRSSARHSALSVRGAASLGASLDSQRGTRTGDRAASLRTSGRPQVPVIKTSEEIEREIDAEIERLRESFVVTVYRQQDESL